LRRTSPLKKAGDEFYFTVIPVSSLQARKYGNKPVVDVVNFTLGIGAGYGISEYNEGKWDL
jgi:hypothetical protein